MKTDLVFVFFSPTFFFLSYLNTKQQIKCTRVLTWCKY
uniref:Uncharacterized protein n=1 Tax=Anguilla anguilla TaxID=7936 RepID=A0A0E9VXZ8_ANGAN